MKKIISIITVCFLVEILFFSCSKKYPDDGFHYVFKSPEKRILGKWRLTKYYINGVDATTFLFNQYIGHCTYGITTSPICYQYGIIEYIVANKDPGNGDFPFTFYEGGAGGGFYFVNDDNYLTWYYGGKNSPYNPFREDNPEPNTHSLWKIDELTNITFKISNTIRDTAYKIEFAKQ